MTLGVNFLRVGRAIAAEAEKQSPEHQNDFYRSAISRAYYAAFLHARGYLIAKQSYIPSRTGDDHRRVSQTLFQINTRLGNHLDDLRTYRNQADYEVEFKNAGVIWKTAEKKSQLIISAMPYDIKT